ncbi:SusC/RagA family TonB-linked outer membrane protein [Alistipes finegoldii]|uniref:SusC/RagA family TonB-linked outer membrane protein n=1 Tax=Alistipes finegoldii TaxID=214856 RepID=A0AA37KT26_9BACT|nr:TonB-dependent receptor [Alistipes finegoldii]BDF64005.1 SusC/RagA family TonB-linked outer membrane protein [Alistipes finegoldii]GKI20353.1 SusC/RagA family TonB-linked outer membrane protein [Alistipes finegoldii]
MKHFRLLFLTVVLSAVCATASAQRVTLDMQNAKLEKVLGQITQQTGLVFNYTRPTINPDKRVSVSVKQAELESVLRQLFDADGIVYEIKDGKVYLADRKGGVNPPPALSAARQRYAGRIVDAAGNPVVGASVVIRGSTTGVSSDIDGRFAIEAREGEVLSVSFVGYTPQTITLGAKTMLTLTLREDTSELEEVVVVGYGTQRRSLVTSAISKVQMNESNMRQVASPTQLLSGRVAGVTTSTGSGNLGSGERMVIRGSSSLSAGNEPLYVIDGIPITNTNANLVDFGEDMSSLATLNISDIESIEVLKDAASAAIYGSRANNGVIVITTKSGKEGKSEVHLNFNTGVTRFANVGKIKMADSGLYVRDFNEGVDNYNRQYGYKPGDSGFKKYIQNPFGTLPDTDWMDLILQTGTFYNGDVSFSGGNVKTRYYVGANYNHQTGVIRTNKMEKMNFKVKISHEFTPWLEVGANVSGNYIKNHQIPGANSGTTIIGRSIQQRPFDRPYKPNGDYYVGGTDELVFHNPMQILDEETAYIENMRYLGNFYATFKYKDKFAFKSSVNTDITQIYDYTYYNENHPYGKGVGRIVDYNRTIKNILVENFATYNDKFGDFSLSAMLGHSFQKVTTRSAKLDGSGFPSPSFDVVGVASSLDAYSGSLSNYAMESYFGRATFSYKDRYVLTATLRTDGSSKFARDNRWGWFPSVSLGWNISKENFMKDSDTELKFRVSYGKTGNQEGIGSYAYQALMSGGYNYGNGSGIAVSTFGNRDLTWEKADQFDAGFDITLFKGRVNIMADAYYKKTKDLLYSTPIHSTTGVTSIISNIGSMRNIGAELTINTHFNFGPLSWLSQFNIATNRNKLTELLGDDKPISIGANRALQVGKEVGAFYLFIMDGIYQYDGEVPAEQYAQGIRAGDVKWRDVDDNNLINDNDRQVIGSSNPYFSGGWNNTFRYKGVSLDVFFTYMYGNDVYAAWKINTSKLGHKNGVLAEEARNRWTGPGSTDLHPRSVSGDTNNTRNSDRWLEDGSFLRLRSLTLSYTFPEKISRRLAMKSLRVYFQGDNLWLATRYSGWDPEVSNNLDPRFMGVDNFSVPQPRMFCFGLNVTF